MDRDITDSGIFDLAQLTASIEPVALRPGHDDTLLGIGSSPLPPPKREPRRKMNVVPIVALLLAFGSVAFALHTRRALERVADAEVAVAVAEPVAEPVEPVREPVAEPIADPVPEPVVEPAEPAAESQVGRRRTPRVSPALAAPVDADLAERDVDELMRLATGLPESPTGAPRASAEAPPLRTLRPDRSEVARVFRALGAEVRRCAPGDEGIVTARVFLSGATGRARSASITGIEGDAASCMERALMNARVGPFLQERLEITFPYRL